ncbi:MAG: hypothetical protein AAGF84_05205 [Planctomycetota bacterium]
MALESNFEGNVGLLMVLDDEGLSITFPGGIRGSLLSATATLDEGPAQASLTPDDGNLFFNAVDSFTDDTFSFLFSVFMDVSGIGSTARDASDFELAPGVGELRTQDIREILLTVTILETAPTTVMTEEVDRMAIPPTRITVETPGVEVTLQHSLELRGVPEPGLVSGFAVAGMLLLGRRHSNHV